MNKKETQVIILSESVAASIIKDSITFFMFAGLMYFNHKVLSGSTFIDVLMIILGMLMLSSRKSSRVYNGSKQGAIKWLEGGESE